MADKMMRIAGRGQDGTAKAIQTKDDGALVVGVNRPYVNSTESLTILAGQSVEIAQNMKVDSEQIKGIFRRTQGAFISSLKVDISWSSFENGNPAWLDEDILISNDPNHGRFDVEVKSTFINYIRITNTSDQDITIISFSIFGALSSRTTSVNSESVIIDSYFIRNQIHSGSEVITIAPGEDYHLPIVDWSKEKTNNVFYALTFTNVYPVSNGFYRLEWQSADDLTDFDVMTSKRGRIKNVRLEGSSYNEPLTKNLKPSGKYSRLVVKNTGATNIYLRSALKYNSGNADSVDFGSRAEHVSISDVATHEERQIKLSVSEIIYLTNDGSEDITFNFNRNVSDSGSFILKPGETISQLCLNVDSLHFKSNSDQPFRMMGAL